MAEVNEKPKVKFKTSSAQTIKPSNHEGLFRDLKVKDPQVQHLWSHQADILRAYQKNHSQSPDVAIEFPTGTGKTLIGLLLAEFRRQALEERVIYLCPTRQLAHQVEQQADGYGIAAKATLAPNYDGINEYGRGSSIAISTYSSLFNTNPRFRDPQVIVLDDAHSSEDYIAKLWSVDIVRSKKQDLYTGVLALITPCLDACTVEGLLTEEPSPQQLSDVELLPIPRFWKYADAFRDLLEGRLRHEEEYYSWSMLSKNLHACHLFVSWRELLLRPIIPPTMTHQPFANAKQRIYMSATLGEGGELERITGVRKIERIPAPDGWDQQGSGRRFFLLPNLSASDTACDELSITAAKEYNRALVLVPTIWSAMEFEAKLASENVKVIKANEIEESLDAFTKSFNAALLLANRYDGIDLPGDRCRLLVMRGLPGGANLLEKFLLTRIRATSLLRDRLRTRFTQGVGRCCRGAKDFSAVILVGQDLLDFCSKSEIRSALHPELQAELMFGIENSEGTLESMLGLLQAFRNQSDEWLNEAEPEIVRRRTKVTKKPDPLAQTLMQTASVEVDFEYDLWKGDYQSALANATKISDQLTGQETEGYRAWWYYLGGCSAWLAMSEYKNEEMSSKAKDLFGRASKISKTISWFSSLSAEISSPEKSAARASFAPQICDSILNELQRLGFSGPRFHNEMEEFRGLINNDESAPFERGLEKLGRYLGFNSSKPRGNATPDSVWLLVDQLAVAFEAKSDRKNRTNPIPVATIRQANTHGDWVKNNCKLSQNAKIITILADHRTTIDREAKSYSDNLYYVEVAEVRKIADAVIAILQRVRAMGTKESETMVLESLYREMEAATLLPEQLLVILTTKLLTSLPER